MFKLLNTKVRGQDFGNRHIRPTLVQNGLIGDAPEVEAEVNKVPCKVLLDTGSQVSTICGSFALQLNLEVKPISDILRVEGASGHTIPYLGCAEASITFNALDSEPSHALFLIVPDTNYNEEVPVLVGTNLLTSLSTNHDHSNLPSPWQMTLNVMKLHRQPDYKAVVRST